ncbi:MAG: GNAT family N-acetyltransferase [Candidatus Heimdallarchaeota archaeon]|nr:GNAT family N-acetyltransferase [Candidatus Heimdallarchaeota archaeon]
MSEDIKYKELFDYSYYPILEEIQVDAWRFADREIVPSRIMFATHRSGGVVIAAFLDDYIVGYVWGWIGLDVSKDVFIYSHHNAVRRVHQDKGIGMQLKIEQKKWAQNRDYKIINWTFDPLQSKNCYINIHKLGAICNNYKLRYWGEMHDELNEGIDTDRFYCTWHINSEHVHTRLTRNFTDYSNIINREQNHAIITNIVDGRLTINKTKLNVSEPTVFVEIPDNFSELLIKNQTLAKKWRAESRKVFTHYFNQGYVAGDFVLDKKTSPRKCYHVLELHDSIQLEVMD